MKKQTKDSVHLEDHAEHLYQTLALMDRLPETAPEWDKLPPAEKARYRYVALGQISSFEQAVRYEGELRAREAVAALAQGPYHKDYSILPSRSQAEVKAIVATAVDTYSRVLEGFFTPLPEFRAAELEPTNENQ